MGRWLSAPTCACLARRMNPRLAGPGRHRARRPAVLRRPHVSGRVRPAGVPRSDQPHSERAPGGADRGQRLRNHDARRNGGRPHRDHALVRPAALRRRDRVAHRVGPEEHEPVGRRPGHAAARGAISGEITTAVGRAIGFDSVRLETGNPGDVAFDPSVISADSNPTQRITFTKKILPTLEVIVSQNLRDSGRSRGSSDGSPCRGSSCASSSSTIWIARPDPPRRLLRRRRLRAWRHSPHPGERARRVHRHLRGCH